MKKIDYFKLAVKNGLAKKKNWLISAFSIIKEDKDKHISDGYLGRIVQESWGMSFLNSSEDGSLVLEKIDDSKANEPLFSFKDKITIDNTWISNVDGQLETTVGNLLFNDICIVPAFGNKFKYVTGRVTVQALEDKIAAKLQDTPSSEDKRSSEYYYVDEYINFVNSLQFISTLSQISSWSATPKGIVAPTGIREFKKELLKKYEGKLTDPVELAKFENELKNFDSEFLKDDPANGTFIKGKVKDTARKKMFLNLGAEAGFEESVELKPVINSLEEGWPTDPEQFTAMMNGLRAGSFSRGSETVKGGVSAKILLRAANNFKIVDTNCETKIGISRIYNESNKSQLLNRYVVTGTNSELVTEENVDSYLGKQLNVRSPLYCKLKGDNICKYCAGLKLFKFPTGVTIPLTEISAIILTASLKKMHGTVLATKKLNLTSLVS